MSKLSERNIGETIILFVNTNNLSHENKTYKWRNIYFNVKMQESKTKLYIKKKIK